ncbi:MAG: pyridoxal phosphate-dependent aminotransferase [Deltaproteobacteria bacterium]|nr:pyridoxal phosphate-dependent aminotransferase [Deltaproteobacteria bacterium]
MGCSRKIEDLMAHSSWIRKMFEEGANMKTDGRGPVYDFSLGNPEIEPPEALKQRLAELAASDTPGMHRYMPNAGYEFVRRSIADYLKEETGLSFTAESVIMSVGAGGGLNAALKALLDPGDKVVCFRPYFVEYEFYVDNHGGKLVKLPTDDSFLPDLDAFEQAIDEKTRVVLTNSPNNPTGVVYEQELLDEIGGILKKKSKDNASPVYWLSDEPYRNLIYDADRAPSIFKAYDSSIMVTSHSKDLALPGERIGYIGISPNAEDSGKLFDAMTFTNRILGFVNAPALLQRLVAPLQGMTVDLGWYKRKRDLLYKELIRYGYEVNKPDGAFYMFPKAPSGDDIEFVKKLQQRRVLVVPGTGFGAPGYFRISYCVNDDVVKGALPAFRQVLED